jgi:FixJ family two-component response regulator
MIDSDPVVFVVDDDEPVRTSLARLIRSTGMLVQTFGSADEFLRNKPPDAPACLVLDVRLPDLNGLDLQRSLARSRHVHTHHFHHGSRRHSDDGARHEGRRDRVPHQAFS